MTRPLLLDLFCGAGVGADGYIAAGFTVIGVDVEPQRLYPGPFIRADARDVLTHPWRYLSTAPALIHASPPCQAHTRAKHLRDAQGGTSKALDLLTPTLAMLRLQGVPWIVENVPGASGMDGAVVECGSAYGLEVRRHRLFLSDAIPLVGSGCDHRAQGRPWGVYHVPGDEIPHGGRTCLNVEHGLAAMGVARAIGWDSLKEGLPPAFTAHIGRQAYLHLIGRA
jgi:DNA (cytosine-5)-methyltransferase 1